MKIWKNIIVNKFTCPFQKGLDVCLISQIYTLIQADLSFATPNIVCFEWKNLHCIILQINWFYRVSYKRLLLYCFYHLNIIMFHNLTTFDLYFRQLKNLHFSGTKFTLKSSFFQNKVYQRFLTYYGNFQSTKAKQHIHTLEALLLTYL